MLVFAGSAQAATCPISNVIEDPPEFVWTDSGGYWSGTLEIGEANLPIGNDYLITRAYSQEGGTPSIPGPTLRMTSGETYVLTFKNTLPFEEPSLAHNDLKDPNITNIHTHGLHVSGETPSDDITRLINGGFCGDYVYEVPLDHMGGTLWYHAHHHGSTYLQVAGGAFGLLIVDDPNDVCLPGEVDPCVPVNVDGMTERLLAIGYLDPNVAGAGGDTLISGTLSPTWTVNGKVQGSLCTPAGEWQHWRVLLADRDARLKTLSVGPECEAVLLARDGVWRTDVPKLLPNNEIELTGASRADLAVRCGADSTISVGNTVVANVVADGTGNQDVGPYSDGSAGVTWSSPRPHYLRDLRSVSSPLNTQSINMGARTVNGEKFDAVVPTFSVDANAIQEWNIKGARNHPFHLHVYHVQMKGACGSAFEDGEYYDTVAGSGCLARFDTNANDPQSSVYSGRTIMHCHILLHEDEGAMGWTDVLQSQDKTIGPPSFPDPSQQALYLCGTPPCAAPTPTLLTAVPADGQVTITWSDEHTADTNVTGYNVYYDNAQLVADAGLTTTYTDTGLTNGQEYCYEVTSYYATCESGFSNILCATPNVQVNCSLYNGNRQACKDEPGCTYSGKNKTCDPI
jgi:FtsP/CotA-like multicopper oxidase with cupredoxin domain